jgi:ATP-binding cassette subfamily C (CFTR/MRP) protein 4
MLSYYFQSSLLLALLKELPMSSGKLTVFGRKAYVPQQPWIFPGSIRENILFGRTYNSVWYEEVIEACALRHDFESCFPEGDATGLSAAGGATLSGGQQTRVSLARYSCTCAEIQVCKVYGTCILMLTLLSCAF